MRELEWREDEEVWGGGACLHLCFGRRWQRGPYIYRKDRRAPRILSLWIKKLGWGWQGFHNKVRKRTWQILLYSIIFSSLSFLLFIFTLCMCVYVAVADWAPKRSSYVFFFVFFNHQASCGLLKTHNTQTSSCNVITPSIPHSLYLIFKSLFQDWSCNSTA